MSATPDTQVHINNLKYLIVCGLFDPMSHTPPFITLTLPLSSAGSRLTFIGPHGTFHITPSDWTE